MADQRIEDEPEYDEEQKQTRGPAQRLHDEENDQAAHDQHLGWGVRRFAEEISVPDRDWKQHRRREDREHEIVPRDPPAASSVGPIQQEHRGQRETGRHREELLLVQSDAEIGRNLEAEQERKQGHQPGACTSGIKS